MIEIIVSVIAIWLLIKAIGLAFKLAWGTTKIIATILLALAVPVFVLCLIFVGGFILLIPVAFIAGAIGLLKMCD